MKRRTLLRSLLALAMAPVARRKLFAQARPSLGESDIVTLRAVAEAVLPTALGDSGREAAVQRFVRWVRNYRESADRGHSYGASTLSQATGPSPAARYPAQFAALDARARALGAASFSSLAVDKRRGVIEEALNEPQRVTNLPARPTGANLVADFMGYSFNSAAGYDLAYDAAIGRDSCRSLDGSDQPPARLTGR
jgi:hypothetical protein